MDLVLKTKTNKVKKEALNLGFAACGVARADYLEQEADYLRQYLNEGRNGELSYMENHFEKRTDPRLLEPGTQTIISVLLNYYTPKKSLDPQAPVISRYAYGKDYHFVMKEKLNQLLGFINNEIQPCKGRVFVDSAPVLDKAWAQRAGLGWIGKNTNLINPQWGSFFFIGELLIDVELNYDVPFAYDRCGTCTRCLDVCPTGALVEPRKIDARRCISFLTIEKKGPIPVEFKELMANRAFGCDLCQDVCPWNKKSSPHNQPDFEPHPKLLELSKKEWFEMDEQLYRELFKKSAVKRTKFSGLRRNLDFLNKK